MSTLHDTVVKGNYCIGCGACAAIATSPYTMRMNANGCYSADIDSKAHALIDEELYQSVCPFSDRARTEDEIGEALFSDCSHHSDFLGYYDRVYAGFVAEGDFRARGSSGGVGKWILAELLRLRLVDAIIQVHSSTTLNSDDSLYNYKVVTTIEDVLSGSKSVYYPVEMSEVLSYVRDVPGRYAITGIPCYIKAVRLLASKDQIIQERIKYCIGLICGHAKSSQYAEMIAWQFGLSRDELTAIDFRKKLPGTKANEKGVQVVGRSPNVASIPPKTVQNLFGTNYNHGFFQYRACDYCDDVVAETSDLSVGDAWLPEYISDGSGTSLLITRNRILGQIIEKAKGDGRLRLDILSEESAVKSQLGGFRQRREGLAYRLYLAKQSGIWYPPKRVKPRCNHISRKRKKIYRLRTTLSEVSFSAFSRALHVGDFLVFKNEMQKLLDQYTQLYKPSFGKRALKALIRRYKKYFIKGDSSWGSNQKTGEWN